MASRASVWVVYSLKRSFYPLISTTGTHYGLFSLFLYPVSLTLIIFHYFYTHSHFWCTTPSSSLTFPSHSSFLYTSSFLSPNLPFLPLTSPHYVPLPVLTSPSPSLRLRPWTVRHSSVQAQLTEQVLYWRCWLAGKVSS